MKLLIVNLQDPSKSEYRNPKTVASWLWGKRLSNYVLFIKSDSGNIIKLNFKSSDVVDIQKTIIETMQNGE